MNSHHWYFGKKIHSEAGHGGRDRIIKQLNNRYANNSFHAIGLFIHFVKSVIWEHTYMLS